MTESEERWLLTGVVAATLLALAGPAARSPDGMEMLALAREWGGGPASNVAAGYWPPLWPLLLSTFPTESAARLLNLLAAAGVAWPLHRLSGRIGGPRAARFALAAWALTPAVVELAVVLDARPLGWLLTTLAVDAVVAGAWGPAVLCAALAPLARPEGLLVAVGVAIAATAARRWSVSAGVLSAALFESAVLLSGRAWEGWPMAWVGTWPTGDLLSLYGVASAPTEYREAALLSGLHPGFHLKGAIDSAWSGPRALLEGVVHAVGVGGAFCAIGGAGIVARKSRLGVLLVLAPLTAVFLTPQSLGQINGTANVMFTAPVLIAAGSALAAEVPVVFVLWLGEAHFGPSRDEPVIFFEGTDVAAAMTLDLRANRPPSGDVYCGFSGRTAVRDAGLRPVPLPSPWVAWTPSVGTTVVVSSVDLRGNDGGRLLEMLEDRHWALARLVDGGGDAHDHWMARIVRER